MENYKEKQFKLLAYINNLDEFGKPRSLVHHEYLHKRLTAWMFFGALVVVGITIYVKTTFF